jgi:hypothetical protein
VTELSEQLGLVADLVASDVDLAMAALAGDLDGDRGIAVLLVGG